MQYSYPLKIRTTYPRRSVSDERRLDLNIGKALADELRWWYAFLTPGQGWGPADNKWRPPWTVVFKGNMIFRVKAEIIGNADQDRCLPPLSA